MNQPQQFETKSISSVVLKNRRVNSFDKLSTAEEIEKELRISEKAKNTVMSGRREVEAVISGEDDRLMVIVGPCSIHDPKEAIEYAERLRSLQQQYASRLLIVMRVYFEKPRTTVGWKGLISSPHLIGSADFETGLRTARQLMININELGLCVATEFLDPLTPPYYSDLVSWGAIGARTTESQIHREMASGLSCSIGFKNGTQEGEGDVAINAMVAARSEHSFLGINDKGQCGIVHTNGNSSTQLILRGSSAGPNYDVESVGRAEQALRQRGLSTRMIVDCSHDNAEKDFRNQEKVLNYVLKYRQQSGYPVYGVMIESNLEDGNQKLNTAEDLKKLKPGVSITDGCAGWKKTTKLLKNAYELA